MDIMQVKDLTFIHNEKKRWLKRPEVFQLGPVNLNVKRGETIAIIGENRSGKSLLAKLLVGSVAEPSSDCNIKLLKPCMIPTEPLVNAALCSASTPYRLTSESSKNS